MLSIVSWIFLFPSDLDRKQMAPVSPPPVPSPPGASPTTSPRPASTPGPAATLPATSVAPSPPAQAPFPPPPCPPARGRSCLMAVRSRSGGPSPVRPVPLPLATRYLPIVMLCCPPLPRPLQPFRLVRQPLGRQRPLRGSSSGVHQGGGPGLSTAGLQPWTRTAGRR